MSIKIPVNTASGAKFFVEVEDTGAVGGSPDPDRDGDASLEPYGEAMGAEDKVLKTSMFRKAVAVVQDISQEVASGLEQTEPKPSEVQLSLDLGFDASGSVWVLKGGAKATLRLQVKWRLDSSERT